MRIYAVIDLQGGQVVHGVAGNRESYRPISSRLIHSAAPAKWLVRSSMSGGSETLMWLTWMLSPCAARCAGAGGDRPIGNADHD